MNAHTERSGEIAPGATFAELGTISLQGHNYTAGGAFITDSRLVAYLGSEDHAGSKAGHVQTWNGDHIGRYTIVKTWRVPTRAGYSYTMCQVNVHLGDGRKYQGRSQGPQMVVMATRLASQQKRRVS